MRYLLLTLLLSIAPAKISEPGLIIMCSFGGIHTGDGAIAYGNSCVLHDKQGGKTAQSVVIYSGETSVP